MLKRKERPRLERRGVKRGERRLCREKKAVERKSPTEGGI